MDTAAMVDLVDAEVEGVLDLRRQLHAVPELGGLEHRTSDLIRGALPVDAEAVAGTGLLARLGADDGPAVAVRAELDALPIAERTGAPFSAEGDRMHACGHDVHMAALVAVVRALAPVAAELPVPFAALFQPSEERDPSGALAVLRDQRSDAFAAFIAVHVHPELPWGAIGVEAGAVNAAADEIRIVLTGVGGHAAYPHLARSPIPALLEIGQAVQALAARVVDPIRPALISIGVVSAGEAANVIPAKAELRLTVRSLSAEDQQVLVTEVTRIAERVADAHRCSLKLVRAKSEPPLVNDAGLVLRGRRLLDVFGFALAPSWRSCGGDDFAHYGGRAPALMAFVGLRDASGFEPASLHTAGFLPPEAAVGSVARAMLVGYLAAADLLTAP